MHIVTDSVAPLDWLKSITLLVINCSVRAVQKSDVMVFHFHYSISFSSKTLKTFNFFFAAVEF